MSASEIYFTSDEAPAVVVVVTVAVVFAWVVGSAVVSVAFFSPFPQAATINADRSVTEPNKILFFKIIVLLNRFIIFVLYLLAD